MDQLKWGTVPDPPADPGRVRIRLKAAAMNQLDLFVLKGLPGLPKSFPHVPGADGMGIVEDPGPAAGRLKAGDRVLINPGLSCGACSFCLMGEHSLCAHFGLVGEHAPGTFGETITLPPGNVHACPEHLSDAEAAALPLTFVTAWRMLFTRARLQAGETVLIHGAGSGVSLAALTLAVAAGARVFITSSDDAKIARAVSLGAQAGINYKKEKVEKAMQALGGGAGADVVVDSVGEATWMASLKCARKGGRIVTCGATSGPNPAEEIRLIFWKQLSILGSTMGSHHDFSRMLEFVALRKIRPVVDRVYPLQEARAAYERLSQGAQFGKIVLEHPAG